MSVSRPTSRPIVRQVTQTRTAVALVFRRRDSLALVTALTVAYLLAYLWAARDLSFRPDMTPGIVVVADPAAAMTRRTGPASFDAIAILDTGVLRWLVSPANFGIGLVLAVLVGISLALTYLAITQPSACGLGASSGVMASVPALLSGTVCCGPVILIALGIQATGVIMTTFAWLLPIGVVLLLGSISYLAARIDTDHAGGG